MLTEEVILKWYKEGHSKGKTTFLEQMKKFIEWLQNAEEGKNLYLRCIYSDHVFNFFVKNWNAY